MVAFQIPKVVPPEETPMISKQVQAIRKKKERKKEKEKRARSSSLMKLRDITKVSVQAVLTKGKSPSTPEETPKQ
jgi:hypothetical protein